MEKLPGDVDGAREQWAREKAAPPTYVTFTLDGVKIRHGMVEHTGYVDLTLRQFPDGRSDLAVSSYGFDPATRREYRDVTPPAPPEEPKP